MRTFVIISISLTSFGLPNGSNSNAPSYPGFAILSNKIIHHLHTDYSRVSLIKIKKKEIRGRGISFFL
nr:MAG TPA: hypothetical protein [Caudoviricetes sp.]